MTWRLTAESLRPSRVPARATDPRLATATKARKDFVEKSGTTCPVFFNTSLPWIGNPSVRRRGRVDPFILMEANMPFLRLTLPADSRQRGIRAARGAADTIDATKLGKKAELTIGSGGSAGIGALDDRRRRVRQNGDA